MRHTQSYLIKKNGTILMKPCWWKDPYGVKCTNAGVKASVIEELVLEDIKRYRDNFLVENNVAEAKLKSLLEMQLAEREQQLTKYKNALTIIQDSYEMGDITRVEWLSRREKRNNDIAATQNDIADINRQLRALSLVKSEDKLAAVESFLEQIETVSTAKERNELYTTIIDKIIWKRSGDDAKIEIEYK